MVLNIGISETTGVTIPPHRGVDVERLEALAAKGDEVGEVARDILTVHGTLGALNQTLRDFIAVLDRRA